MVQTDRQATDDNKIRRKRIACWIPKATNTHSEHVGLIFTTLSTQIWFSEGVLMLRYIHITCLVMRVTNGMIFEKKVTEHEMFCFYFLYNVFPEASHI
jgi:hypothetical protein